MYCCYLPDCSSLLSALELSTGRNVKYRWCIHPEYPNIQQHLSQMAHKAEIRRQINPVMYWFKMINAVLPARIQFFLGLTTGVDLVFDLHSKKYSRGTSFFVEINRTSIRWYFWQPLHYIAYFIHFEWEYRYMYQVQSSNLNEGQLEKKISQINPPLWGY